MEKATPLWQKLYFRPVYTEFARMVGYRDVPVDEVREQINKLIKKHGKDKIEAASTEVLEVDTTKDHHVVRLTKACRKVAAELLGLPPEHHETNLIESILVRGEGEKGVENVRPQKKARKPRKTPLPAATVEPRSSAAPVLQHYREAKERHPGMILLFRMGDFYELFDDDAEKAAKLLGLTLTSRDGKSMSGFPHHALEKYLQKLLQAGERVAVCDQVVEARSIQREVTRVVTPGEVQAGN